MELWTRFRLMTLLPEIYWLFRHRNCSTCWRHGKRCLATSTAAMTPRTYECWKTAKKKFSLKFSLHAWGKILKLLQKQHIRKLDMRFYSRGTSSNCKFWFIAESSRISNIFLQMLSYLTTENISAAYQQPPPFLDSKEPFWGHDYYGLWLFLFIIAIIIFFFLLLKIFGRKEQTQVESVVLNRSESGQIENEQQKGWT